jgi:hypothetical protein
MWHACTRSAARLGSWLSGWLGESPVGRPAPILTSIRSARTVIAGTHEALYQYLEERYASTVVLTFAQIEDLLGRPLAASARVDREWWSNDDLLDPRGVPLKAWTRASRTATVNLGAQTVLFERIQA